MFPFDWKKRKLARDLESAIYESGAKVTPLYPDRELLSFSQSLAARVADSSDLVRKTEIFNFVAAKRAAQLAQLLDRYEHADHAAQILQPRLRSLTSKSDVALLGFGRRAEDYQEIVEVRRYESK